MNFDKFRFRRIENRYCRAYYFYYSVCVFLILAAIAALLIGILIKHESKSKSNEV